MANMCGRDWPGALPAPSFGSDTCIVFSMIPQGKRTGLSWVPAGRWCFHCIFAVVFQGKCSAPCFRVEVGRCRERNFMSGSHIAPRQDGWDSNVGASRGHAGGSPGSLLELRAAGLGKLSVAPAPSSGVLSRAWGEAGLVVWITAPSLWTQLALGLTLSCVLEKGEEKGGGLLPRCISLLLSFYHNVTLITSPLLQASDSPTTLTVTFQ